VADRCNAVGIKYTPKGFIMKKHIIAFIIFFAVTIPAQARIENIVATGYGASEYEATTDAIDNAIRQTSTVSGGGTKGRVISGEYKMEDTRKIKSKSKSWWKFWDDSYKEESEFEYSGGKINEKLHLEERDIEQKYSGQIEGYKVLSMSEKNNKFTARIEARVFIVDDYQSPDMVKKSKYRVAVAQFAGKRNWDCLNDTKLADKIERGISQSKKMTVVDRKNFDAYTKELGLINDDLASRENKSKLHQVAIADYILVGKIDNFSISRTSKEIQLTGEKINKTSATLELSYKLIETATMEIVSSDSVVKTVSYDHGASCGAIADTLGRRATDELVNAMIKDIF